MSKQMIKNMAVAFLLNILSLTTFWMTKEHLNIIQFMLVIVGPVIISIALCFILNKGHNLSRNKNKTLIMLYFIMNVIFYVGITLMLRDGRIVSHIIAQSQFLNSETILINQNSNYGLSLVMFLSCSFFGHKMVVDRL